MRALWPTSVAEWRGRAPEVARAFREAPEVDVTWALVAFVALVADPGLGWDGGHLNAVAVVLAGATALPLVVRRRYPLGTLVAVTGGLLVCLAVFHPNVAAVGTLMVVLYTIGLQGRRLRTLLVAAAMAPVVTAAVVITSKAGLEAGTTLARLALLLAALAAGDARRGRLALVEARAQETERRREAASVHRFDEERLRLAHELHDTIAHTLVGINTQAAAAVQVQRKQPNESLDALQAIVRSSADALAELRTTLKVVRPPSGEAPLRPAQSLADLPELVEGVRSAGVDVELLLDAAAQAVPATSAHGAYRIVQESLTNVLRHSTAKRAVVRVAFVGDQLTVEVQDDGRVAPRDSGAAGHGLRGMTERAAALGGRCEAAATPDGGWRVWASLPARLVRP
ncbi:MAG TPA: sensor histidine kinase [Solirubrobacteraceae bacterium]|nr:sensor histidine kinase [Solirubrobacteraceae bacterium]